MKIRHRPEHVTGQPVVFITGAASGIGAAAARQAVARGYRVVLADVNIAGAKQLAGELGQTAISCEIDVRDARSWEAAFDVAETGFGPVDVLVNNAGIIHTGHARGLTLAQHRDVVDVNLIGTITGVLTALPRMTARGRGHIVNVCSMTSFLPLSGYATYGATKHAIRAFHHSVAIEERGGPVTFSIVHPPSTRTPMLEQEMADPTAVIAFAEKSQSAEEVAAVIIDAIAHKPVEVVFPPIAGRFQRLVGALPAITHAAIPLVEAVGRRKRAKLQRIEAPGGTAA
jgi:short-subunit dehydrogenase